MEYSLLKYLTLTRPIISFDLETTGTDTKKDKIVSISAYKHFPDGIVEKKYYLINPMMPIPPESTKVHGITDEMVKNSPTFPQIAKNLHIWFTNCDTIGFNSFDFDIPLLGRELYECGILWDYGYVVDIFKIEKIKNAHNLMATYKRYMGNEFEGAHNSEADNEATVKIFEKMLEIDPSMPPHINEIHDMVFGKSVKYADFSRNFYYDDEGCLMWNINPKKGTKVDPNDSLCGWFLDPKKDFSQQSKDILRKFITTGK